MCLMCAALPVAVGLGTTRRIIAGERPGLPGAGGSGARTGGRPGVPPLVVGIGLALVGLAMLTPGSLQFKLDVLGFGVCHQLLSHSLIIGGHPLPVCARCTGIYLGAAVTWILLRLLHPRATGLPAPRMLLVLGVLFAAMVADGINSTFQSLPDGHGLWETTNFLRILTGAGAGVAMTFVLYPIAQESFWRRALIVRESVLDGPFELFGYGLALAVLVGLALSSDGDATAGWVYWLIALLSMAGLLGLLTAVNALLAALVSRSEGRVGSWRAALLPLSLALVLALVELLVLAELRGALAPTILANGPVPAGFPLTPGVR